MSDITKEEVQKMIDDLRIRIFKYLTDNYEMKPKKPEPVQGKWEAWKKPTQTKIDEMIEGLPL